MTREDAVALNGVGAGIEVAVVAIVVGSGGHEPQPLTFCVAAFGFVVVLIAGYFMRRTV